MKTISKKKAIAIIVIASLVFAVLACSVFFSWRKDIAYSVGSRIQAMFAPSLHLQESETETVQISMDALLSNARTTVEQSLLLINPSHPLSEVFSADVSPSGDTDLMMNLCMQGSYADLAAAVSEKCGESLYIRSAYRTAEEQAEELEANSDTATAVGASEHQAGLALDVYVPYYAGSAFLKTETGRWVNSHCHEYGFIIRYPAYGKSETGIGFEPWHLRYVGIPHAQILAEHCLTLEEYVECLEIGKLYRFGSYIITRQTGEVFAVPTQYTDVRISEDNTGAYILTFCAEQETE